MKSIRQNQFKRFVYQFFLSGIISGAFTYIFFQQQFINFILGFIIGAQVYTYIILFETYIKPKLKHINLLLALLISSIVYVALIIIAVLVSFVIINKFNFSVIYKYYDDILFSTSMLYGIFFGLILSLTFSFYSMFDTLLGKNYLIKIFAGKYNRPFEEERIFMFLDLKSSTSIAEKLGHKKFLSLLNDFFYDLAEPVAVTRGQIYKYVGDEAIITWRMKKGVVHNRPIECFFQQKKQIAHSKKKYHDKYGLVPEFKAGLHGGVVVTGEMGFI
nr:adenylate/guanylate cyclase domain-containing protein [Bacteroidota bacterium]